MENNTPQVRADYVKVSLAFLSARSTEFRILIQARAESPVADKGRDVTVALTESDAEEAIKKIRAAVKLGRKQAGREH